MASNYVQDGNVITLTAPRTVESGQGALVNGNIFGIAMSDTTSAASGEFGVTGVWDIACDLAEVFAEGANVYWDNTNFKADSSSSGGTLIGVAIAAKAGGTGTTVRTRLNGISV